MTSSKKFLILLIGGGVVIAIALFIIFRRNSVTPVVDPTPSPVASLSPTPLPSPAATPITLVRPLPEFESRITKKAFGVYYTPATSPVQPDRFTGWHTGVDVEYADVTTEVPVLAIADGTVLTSRTATGYGGVIAIQHVINGQSLIGVYGHLDPKSLVATGAKVAVGQQIGVLGDDKSSETDGERKHLHLSIVKGTVLTIKGYVQTQAELAQWIDPVSLYK